MGSHRAHSELMRMGAVASMPLNRLIYQLIKHYAIGAMFIFVRSQHKMAIDTNRNDVSGR